MQIRPTALTFGLIIYSFITLFYVYTEFGIDSSPKSARVFLSVERGIFDGYLYTIPIFEIIYSTFLS